MTGRLRNGNFTGSSAYDVDPDRPTYTRVIKTAHGDLALGWDVITGENSPPTDSIIDHTGYDTGSDRSRGDPLGVPLGNTLERGLTAEACGTTLAAGDPRMAYIFMIDIDLPRGEDSLSVRFATDSPRETRLVAWNDDMSTEIASTQMTKDGNKKFGTLTGLTGGTNYIIVAEEDLAALADINNAGGEPFFIRNVSLYFPRRGNPTAHPASGPTSPYRVATTVEVAGDGTAVLPNPTWLDEVEFDAASGGDGDMPLSSRHVNEANATINTLEEFVQGCPAGGNAALTLQSSADTAPERSAFHDHSRSTYTNEGLIDFPIGFDIFGGIGTDGKTCEFTQEWEPPGYDDYGGGSPPWPKHIFMDEIVTLPHFPDGADSKLRVRMIATCNLDGVITGNDVDGFAKCIDLGGAALIESSGTFVRIGTTRFFRCKLDGVDFHPDETQILRLSVEPISLNKTDSSGWSMISTSYAFVAG